MLVLSGTCVGLEEAGQESSCATRFAAKGTMLGEVPSLTMHVM